MDSQMRAQHPASTRNRNPCRILVGEDDEMLTHFLRDLLLREGYDVVVAASGPAVLAHASRENDLLLLDLNLPELDGLSLLRQLRPHQPELPILVLTARDRAEGLLPALDAGADDCLLKPFSYLELLARIRALLRRRTPAAAVESACADLLLDRKRLSVMRADRRIELSQREFALLECLMRTPDIPVPRAVLHKEVWGGLAGTTNVVDVYMKYVRDKVDLPGLPKLVRTVRGTGYMISAA